MVTLYHWKEFSESRPSFHCDMLFYSHIIGPPALWPALWCAGVPRENPVVPNGMPSLSNDFAGKQNDLKIPSQKYLLKNTFKTSWNWFWWFHAVSTPLGFNAWWLKQPVLDQNLSTSHLSGKKHRISRGDMSDQLVRFRVKLVVLHEQKCEKTTNT